jgi:hypothetical protein
LGSSEQKQAQFIVDLFQAWDANQTQIPVINICWLNDKTSAEVDQNVQYYGISSTNFREYIGSLGLRTNAGKDKAAFTALKSETNKRGWI